MIEVRAMDEKDPNLEGDKIEVKIGGAKPAEPTTDSLDNLPEVPEVTEESEKETELASDEELAKTDEGSDSQPVVEIEPSTASLQEIELQEVPEQPAAVFPQPKKSRKKLVFGVVGSTFVLAAAGCAGAWLLLKDDTATTASTKKSDTVKVQKMSGEVSLIDGTAQVSLDNETWKPLAVNDQVKEGSYYKTDTESRLVVNLDDGSAVRLNSNSVVKFDSLATKAVAVTNVSGEMYSRLVKSDRTFTVKIDDMQYVALGTAYVTLNTEDTQGVEVYESKVGVVKPGEENVEVSEGKYYYYKSIDTKKEKKLNTLSIDALKKDSFVKWNYEQDKKISEFKDELGYLENFDKETTTKDDEKDDESSDTTASLSLSGAKYDTGVKLTWSLKNLTASKGFKVLKSLDANPTFGEDDAVYVSDSSSRSYAWSIKDGKTYHFRVCIYNGSGCSKYSNDVAVTAPKSDSSGEPSGTLTLSPLVGNNVKWKLEGSAPKGYKLVWSTSKNPVYPGSDFHYYSDPSEKYGEVDAHGGKYYVKVCMYTGSGCVNYSNQIELNL